MKKNIGIMIPTFVSGIILGLIIGSAFGHQLRKDYHYHVGKINFGRSMNYTLSKEHIQIAPDIFDSMEVVYQQISREHNYDPYDEITGYQSWAGKYPGSK